MGAQLGPAQQRQNLQRARQLGQLEVNLKGLQVRQRIDDTSQQRVESELNQDIQRTFGGLGGGR